MWDVLRYFLSLRLKKRDADNWLTNLKTDNKLTLDGNRTFAIPKECVHLLSEYLCARKHMWEAASRLLRDEDEALKFCEKKAIEVSKNRTQNQTHHQSSKAMIATVTHIAETVCKKLNITIKSNPQRRCVWCNDRGLHVSARNLDGAIPSLGNPEIIWEIKEYWGKTSGGSKMSDAVYECHLVGRELREFERQSGERITHIVFLDGKTQWSCRRTDLLRFIDLLNQGLIDFLFIGREVESSWQQTLLKLLSHKTNSGNQFES